MSTNNPLAQTGGPGRQGCPEPALGTGLTVAAAGPDTPEGHAVARPPSVELRWCPWHSGGGGRWELSQHAQRKPRPKNWAEGGVSKVPAGLRRPSTQGGAQLLPPVRDASLEESTPGQGLQHLAGLGLKSAGPEAVLGPVGTGAEGSTARPHQDGAGSLTWKSYNATMFSCFNS